MAVCLKWQLQLGSVLRIGGCQSFGGSYTFPSTVIHHCITIRRARTHCRRGERGSSGNGGAASAVGGAQVMRKHWCGHTSFVEVLSASYFNNPLPTPPPPPPYHVKLYWGLSPEQETVLLRGPNTFWDHHIKAPQALLRVADITLGALHLVNDKCIRLAKSTRHFAVGPIMALPILWKPMTERG